MKCDELERHTLDVWEDMSMYEPLVKASDVDAAIDELKTEHHKERHEYIEMAAQLRLENAELKKKLMPCLNGDCILTCEVVENYGKENAELKARLETVQATAYAESVDAGMRERRLKRALWIARALRAEARKNYWYARSCHEGDKYLWSIDGSAVKYIGCIKRTNYDWLLTWSEVESKCQAKAEEYK